MKLFFMEAERILGNSSHFTKLSGTGNLFNWFSTCTNFFFSRLIYLFLILFSGGVFCLFVLAKYVPVKANMALFKMI